MASINIEYRYDTLNRLVETIIDDQAELICYDAAGNRLYRGPAPAGHAQLPAAFRELQYKSICLKEHLKNGLITDQDYNEELKNLRLQDDNGTWWHLQVTGTWLKWNGSSWTEAAPLNDIY